METETRASLHTKILKLPDEERALLVEDLVVELSPNERQRIDRAIADECAERMRAYNADEMSAVSFEEFKRTIESRWK
jgi:putative addiction module component (TIGR02574 family)